MRSRPNATRLSAAFTRWLRLDRLDRLDQLEGIDGGDTGTHLAATLGAVVAGLTPGTLYFFRFRVMTKAGLSAWSTAVSLIVH